MKKRSSSIARKPPVAREGAALLWDESFLWAVMAYRALKKLCLPFDLVRSADIRAGCLDRYNLLFVPGGWSSNKMKALGDEGAEAVRAFVKAGGSYLGFCGGAGLATEDGLGLLNVRRKPTAERVPSFSGRIALRLRRHPIWADVAEPVFHAWWPPQFGGLASSIRVLASYGKALPDSFSSDLNTGDVSASGGWKALEELYRINLDPARLRGEPAVIEGRCGQGRVVLSLVHFDTPDDPHGESALRNLWAELAGGRQGRSRRVSRGTASCAATQELEAAASRLIELGRRNFLWFDRGPYLLQWRRGVRGLEYATLWVMVRELAQLLPADCGDAMERRVKGLTKRTLPFIRKAEKLLVRERIAMQQGSLTYEKCDDPAVCELREELFSKSKSYGGRYKELLDEIDELVFSLLKEKEEVSL
ncbi:MAG: BPL-N domain-containing protein [Thermodesulfovibrionales bacterium]